MFVTVQLPCIVLCQPKMARLGVSTSEHIIRQEWICWGGEKEHFCPGNAKTILFLRSLPSHPKEKNSFRPDVRRDSSS
jgi:hypothetical protein